MSNSLDSFLTRIGDVTIERVTPRGGPKSNEAAVQNEPSTNTNMNNAEPQTANEESSEESSGESSDGEQEKKHGALHTEEIEEIHSEGSGDDMDLDETIDSQIGVRVDSERQSHCPAEEDDEEPVNILDTLPLEGAPIEGQEVSEADLLGKPISKDTDDESVDNEKTGSHSGAEDGIDGNKRHGDSEHSENVKKKQKKDDGTEESTSECETKAEKKLANMRRNIREVMDETQLDEATLSAQRQEMERLRRVQEQQRIIREVQRQMTINRQNNKTQTRVISLLQGKQNQAGTTISQSSSSSLSSSSTQVRLPNTVLLKVNSSSGTGSQTGSNLQSGQIQRKSIEGTRWQKGRGVYPNAQTSISRVPNRSVGPTMLQQRIRMMTPSVSISPVVPKKEPIDRPEYYSDSDVSDIEAEEALREKHMHLARKMSSGPKSQKVAKGKDVVTISSSSESSDDDCIVLSDPSGEEETDNEDDPSNSGMHTNDRYNIPDEHGRVLINVGHPEIEPDVFLAPQVARIIKPHQIGGIRFLYDNIVESIERYKTSSGFGCILAHSMGLGKTLQVASFCDIFFRCTTAKTVLCIMPINTLQNWLAEFNMWLPYEDPTSMEKNNKITNIKSESEMESKSEIKEECGSQSDMSNISRPISTESAHRYGQENVPQSLNIMSENPYTHQGYENHMMSSYVQDSMLGKTMPDHHPRINPNYPGDITQSSMYNTNPNSIPNFDPMKPELNCHAMQGRPNIPPPNISPLNIPPPNLPPSNLPPPNLPPPNLPPPNLPPPNLPPPNLPPPNLPPPNLPPPNLPPPNLPPPNLPPPNLPPPNLPPPNLPPPNLAPPNLPPPNLPPPNLPPPNLPPPNLPPPNLPPPNLPPPKFGMENQNSNMYTTMENQSQGTMFSDIENRNSGPMYPNNHPSGPIYSNYNNPPNTFPNYTNQPRQDLDHEPKKENILHQNTEINVKREPEDTIKKEEGTTKEEIGEDKKNIEKVKTTYMVDAPIGMELRPRHFRLHILNDSHKTMTARAKVIQEWQTGGGVLLIGYELYRQLSMKKPNKAKRKRGQPFKDTVDVEEEDKNKGLLDEMHSALVSPGPDLVICDEGHRIKNSHASISMALKQMRTKRRIVLTGYPLQNNLLEYWCMVDFVRPNYLGTKSEFCNMFERPIQNGQCIDSTPQDIRLMRYRAHVLHALLEGFVQRRSHSVLQVSLPRKEEYILLVRMTPHQRKLYDTFMNQVVKTRAVPNPLKAFAVCCKIWNHPDILYYFLRKRQANEEDDLDLEETIGEKLIPGGKRSKARQSKGESKKGKKTNTTIKNKPAASVQPNPSSSNVDNTEGDSTHSNTKQNNYTNYSMPTNNSGYSNSMSQAPYPGYQNYRSNDQNTYYRNDNNHGEYNEFYNNQGQQRYGNQPFPTYTQNTNYNSAQGYNNQSQNYIPPNDQSVNHPQRYPSGPPNSDFRPDQNQGNNYETSGIYPRQPYTSYPDQGRNYGTSVNQGPNNYSQVSNQTSAFQAQLPNQSNNIPVPEYSPYAPQNQAQNYGNAAGQTNPIYTRNDNQPLQTSALGYTPNQGNQNAGPTPQTGGYLSNQQGQNPPPNQSRGFSPNQPNQNLGLQNSSHGYGNQQTQGMPHQNQQHGYPTQVNPNSAPQTPLNFNQQTSNSIPQNQSHGYMTNQQSQAPISQNQMRGYPPASNQINVPQNATYPQSQTAPSTNISNQVHAYSSDQQGPNASTSNSMHGYPHLVPSSTSQNSSSTYPPPQQTQQSAAPPNQNHGYTTNHQGSTPQNSTHRYNTAQQGQISQPQNQALSYSQNQQSQNSTLNQNDQLYPRNDNQQQSQNYTSTSAPHEFPNDRQGGTTSANSTNNYPPNQTQTQNPILSTYPSDGSHQSQVGQIKGPDDPYWQRDYSGQPFRTDQCNDTYYRDPNVNRFQNNYFPSQSYSNQSYDYAGNHNTDVNTRSDDPKTSQASMGPHIQNAGACDKSNKDMPSNIIPNQSMHQSNLSNKSNYNTEANCPNSTTPGPRSVQGLGPSHSPRLSQVDLSKEEEKEKEELLEKDKDDKSDDEILTKDEEKECKSSPGGREDPGIPYDWATELMKGYVPGLIDASAKMTLFFCILEEAIRLGDRVLAFSQSLFTLNLIEDFLSRNSLKYPDGQTDAWIKNVNYYRLDGSTSALEREKLINEFNNNPKIHLFLVSTRAGSLGINLVGANRAIVFDASWNPCHDTQAVCRVYRYGQQKPCFVYRLVTDNCLERKIYDRQISKQGMADRVVDQCNPDAHLSLKDATTLSWDWEEDSQVQDFSQTKDSYSDEVMHRVLECHSSLLTKQPFHHESLLVDRKDKKLSQAEKRLARRGYELEKMAANCSRPSYNYVPGNTATRAGGLQIRAIRGGDTGTTSKPVASVRPMQQRGAESLGSRSVTGSRWIPAEVWQRQGMSAQEMTLPLDVVIPTNSPDKGSIVLKAGQRVMVLKSPKGIYMQLESGKIIAIRTALKLNQQKREEEPKKGLSSMVQRNSKPEVSFPLRNNSAISIIPKSSTGNQTSGRPISNKSGSGPGYRPFADKEISKRPKPVATAAAKPYLNQVNLTNQVSLSRLPKVKQEPVDHSTLGENSNSSDGQVRTEQRVEEVRLEDVVAEVSSNTDYSPATHNRISNSDTDSTVQKSSEEGTQVYIPDNVTSAQSVQTQHDQSESELSAKVDKQCSHPEEKESTKVDAITSFNNPFSNQNEKRDTATNDDIIIEEQPHPAPSTSVPLQPLLTPQPVSSAMRVPSTPSLLRSTDAPKNVIETSSMSVTSVCTGTNTTTTPKIIEPCVREAAVQGDPANLPQGYPYAQYPRYYDYTDPRSRSLPSPYGTYFPGVPAHTTNPRLPVDTKSQSDAVKPMEDRAMMNVPTVYSQVPSTTAKTLGNTTESKATETTVTTTVATVLSRDETHIPTAFSHPTSTRYPGPYPPGPYDPYSQHYPPAPGSTAAYPPGGAPGYPAYGGPTYNTEYARMYSAFHGPPPPADPYMHRGYAPPSSHPPNYYPPFPHPPPPYPNYSFLSPYPNPNMPSEPQPPAQ